MVSWTGPDVTRIEEPFTGPERGILDGFLDWHRATLLWKCAGLAGEQLALASVPPSNLSLLGIVRHMADVERAWFRIRFRNEPLPRLYDYEDAAFEHADPARAEADFAALPGQTRGYLPVEVVEVPVGAGGQDRAGVLFGLRQAGDDERLVPAQDRGLGFDAGPLLEPAVQLLLALLQVIPQAGHRAAGVQLGCRVEAGREVLSRAAGPPSRSC